MKETIGQQLRQARETRKLSLEQVANATHMRARYLRALEEGDYALLPSMAQARGFLRTYAGFLNLDPEPFIQELDGDKLSAPPLARSVASGPAESPALNYQQADEIFREIGQGLLYQREVLGLSIDDVARYTHLRRHYLQALEAGRLDDLPSPVQGRGMLNNYAIFLGMDPEPLLLRFAEGLQARLSVRQVARADPVTRPVQRRRRPLSAFVQRLFSPDILIGATFAIFLVIFIVWGAIRIFALNTDQVLEPTAPSIAEILLATPSPNQAATSTSSPQAQPGASPQAEAFEAGSGTATVVFSLPTGEAPGVQVYVTVLQRAWLRAIVDGEVEFEGRVIPGSAYPFVGGTAVELLTSNGAGLQVFYNQQDLGVLGDFGQVVDRIYTAQGILVPTPSATFTPTLTPRVTATGTPPPPLP